MACSKFRVQIVFLFIIFLNDKQDEHLNTRMLLTTFVSASFMLCDYSVVTSRVRLTTRM
jgi:hypothetical protein